MATTQAAKFEATTRPEVIVDDDMAIPTELEEQVSGSILDEKAHRATLQAFEVFGAKMKSRVPKHEWEVAGSSQVALSHDAPRVLSREEQEREQAEELEEQNRALKEQRMEALLQLETDAQLKEARAKGDSETIQILEEQGLMLDPVELECEVLMRYEQLKDQGARPTNKRHLREPIPPLCNSAECFLPRQHFFFEKECLILEEPQVPTPPVVEINLSDDDQDALPDEEEYRVREADQSAWLSNAKARSKALSSVSSLITPSAVAFGRGLPVHAHQDAITALREELANERAARKVSEDRSKLLEEQIRAQNTLIDLLKERITTLTTQTPVVALPHAVEVNQAPVHVNADVTLQGIQVIQPQATVEAPAPAWKPRRPRY